MAEARGAQPQQGSCGQRIADSIRYAVLLVVLQRAFHLRVRRRGLRRRRTLREAKRA
jgi:hypothetical protein